MKKIKLTQGRHTIVDDENYEWLNKYNWYFHPRGYAIRSSGSYKKVYMHRDILKAQKGEEVDHVNLDKLDNRRTNIRICTRQENSFNRFKQSNNTSGFKGVCWYKARKKWRVFINYNGKFIHFGYFKDKAKAVLMHNKKAKEISKKENIFIRLNPLKVI